MDLRNLERTPCNKCHLPTLDKYKDSNNLDVCLMCLFSRECIACKKIKQTEYNMDVCTDCWKKITISKVTDNIYLSNYRYSKQYDKLKELGITRILTIGRELDPHLHNDFTTMHIPIDDHPSVPIRDHFDSTHDFIDKGKTLVHCYAGISRSATIVISYLMKKHNMSFEEALSHCKKVRPIVNPNQGFIQQLTDYDIYLKAPSDTDSELMFQLD